MVLKFKFDASVYVRSGFENAEGDFTTEDRNLFAKIRQVLPELNEWGDLALGMALWDYFQQVYLISWMNLSEEELARDRLIEFLSFLHYQQTIGEWPWGFDIDKLKEHGLAVSDRTQF
ncbi:hypothetical protein NTH44_003351 [Vibrio metoecus]|nr:hypothetical protein [Vibrio cholerae]